MTQLDQTVYPLPLDSLMPHAKRIGNLEFTDMLKEFVSYSDIRTLGLTSIQMEGSRTLLNIEFPSTVTREIFIESLASLNPSMIVEEGQVLGHDHDRCPIDHVFCGRQGEFDFNPMCCIGAAVYHSHGNPHAFFLTDLWVSEGAFNQPYRGDELLRLNQQLYEQVWLPLAKQHNGRFTFTSDY
ncbi:hypothetical protein C0431_12890 [bacterium]|nr:hypothetical protein [bacterium]